MKWEKKDGLFLTYCSNCGCEKLTKKRPYNTTMCVPCGSKIGAINSNKPEMYTKERNEKVSKGKREWWSKQDSKELMNTWLGSYRDKMMNHFISNPEKEYVKYLTENNINFEHQVKINGFYFDFLLTDENKLVEIDGKYWHPETINKDSQSWEVRNYNRDRKKDMLAKELGYELERIRV